MTRMACACRAKGAEGMLGEGSAALLRVEQTDLINYGLIPEFVGRFPVISTLQVRHWLTTAAKRLFGQACSFDLT